MSRIHVLSKQITELIAAGEVVERPASVVKEIMENSIDAGASTVTLEIKNGGITYIRITDNGSGISKNDVSNAFLSHATSKISSAEDLNAILTLGFRGEALASIAAVSKVELMTRTAGEELGTRYCIEGGEQILLDDAGCPKGTTLIIRDLFYNTPARMKFLKKDVTEANAVAGVVDRIALSHPEVSIRFIRDGKQALLTSGDGKLLSAAYAIFGKDFSAGLIPAEYSLEGIKVSGYVSKPLAARPNRSMQFFFLNGRLIKTATGATAVREAYKNSIMIGKFPSCILNIEISPELVDVNVHPAKIEVRFANEKQLFNVIYYCVKNAILGGDTRPNIRLSQPNVNQYFNVLEQVEQIKLPVKNDNYWVHKPVEAVRSNNPNINILVDDDEPTEPVIQQNSSLSGNSNQTKNNNVDAEYIKDVLIIPEVKAESSATFIQPVESEANFNTKLAEDNKHPYNTEVTKTPEEIKKMPESSKMEEPFDEPITIIGEAFKTYIIAEIGDKILIIDKHAAHERMIYDKLKNREPEDASQILLMPVTVTLNKEEYSAVLENRELLKETGFIIDDFGAGMVIVQECPMILDIQAVEEVIMELAGYLLTNKQELISEKIEWLYHSMACRAAIKAGDFTSDYERERFVKNLLHRQDIRYCPHGRPVMVEMKQTELEKKFGRL